jgi:hypothetical protein
MLLQVLLVLYVAFIHNKIKQDLVCQHLKVNEVFEGERKVFLRLFVPSSPLQYLRVFLSLR